ncbi:division plane positioning ATPase MipZ [Sphingomonas oryzagri]|jgi:chromosome partitioning protein|uniref:Division plane positioning ATPase MipZ n=1 Tax=Sphingomonas oryzagri TaxID=3042314 RepID=A0ABT6N5I4_9SPHN|nr:division plane positioning ATPase MipZ [Sphingomonas oryzagri]MDH7640378.1 division plane positioning ATPase MipZ [Sphingomonas oryzagri]
MTQRAHLIVFANEKGGTGKSTTAVHVAVALAAQGRRVAVIDLDTRQRTMVRYLENRAASARKEQVELASPRFEVFDPEKDANILGRIDALAEDAEFVIVDTPGRDDPYAMKAVTRADTLVTPINDSFIDLDLIGQVDPDTYRIKRPSFYAEVVWDARKVRAKTDGGTVDWVVLRNRLQHLEAKNMRRVGQAVDELSKRVGFRVIPGLGERVIYRELFPKGLTLLDLGAIKEVGLSHVAARQELREMVAGLQLPEPADLFNRPAPTPAASVAASA